MKGNRSIDAWNSFCDEIKEAGQILVQDTIPENETIQAEGIRFLIHMIQAGFENTYEFADTFRPVLSPMVNPTLLYEGAGSAAHYLQGYIDGSKNYRIYGRRGTAPLLEIETL